MKHVRHEGDVKAALLTGRERKLVVGPFEGQLKCHTMCGGISRFPPGSRSPAHRHEEREEIIYVIEGQGSIEIEGTPEPLRAGDFISLPAGIQHSLQSSGEETLTILFMFAPPIAISPSRD